MNALDPYFNKPLSDRQLVALKRLREDRLEESDSEYVLEALFIICNPYPNTHTVNTHDVAMLNGRREVWNLINTNIDAHDLKAKET